MSVDTPNLALPGSVVLGEGAGTWWNLWNQLCNNLETRLTKKGSASPAAGGVSGEFIGQLYVRTGTNRGLWICTATGSPSGAWMCLTDRQDYKSVTSAAGTTNLNADTSNYFKTTLTENTTFAAPSNCPPGTVICIEVTGAAGTRYTTSWNAVFKIPTGSLFTNRLLNLNERMVFMFVAASNGDFIYLNNRLGSPSYDLPSTDQNITTTDTILATTFRQLGFVGTFRLHGQCWFQRTGGAGGQMTTLRVRMGTNNSILDPVQAELVGELSSSFDNVVVPFDFLITMTNVNQRCNFSFQNSFSPTMIMKGSGDGVVRSICHVTEVIL